MKSLLLLILCLLAAVLPWIHGGGTTRCDAPEAAFPGWSAAPIPPGLRSLPLRKTDDFFAQHFPGRLAVFGEGNRTWIVRWVTRPTRKLHPAGDCLRAAGYEVKPDSATVDAHGCLWGVCTAARDHEALRIRERIFAPDGAGWSDVSAWYWHALLGKTSGPWWAVTEMERTR